MHFISILFFLFNRVSFIQSCLRKWDSVKPINLIYMVFSVTEMPSKRRPSVKRARTGPTGGDPSNRAIGKNLTEADVTRIINTQLTTILPELLHQIHQNVPVTEGGNNNNTRGTIGPKPRTVNPIPPAKGCTYKYFTSCNPPIFHGQEGPSRLLNWIEEMEKVIKISQCLEEHKVMYASCSLKDQALTWWNMETKTLGESVTDCMSWNEFKTLITAQYCPINEIQKLQDEFWNHTMIGADLQQYTNRFHELMCLLPTMFPTEEALVGKYMKGLVPQIRAHVISAEHVTLKRTILLAAKLTDDAIRSGKLVKQDDSNILVGHSSQKCKHCSADQKSASQGNQVTTLVIRNDKPTIQETQGYKGRWPECNQCSFHHTGPCPVCERCGQTGHFTRYCHELAQQIIQVPQRPRAGRTCFRCNSPDHYARDCPLNSQ